MSNGTIMPSGGPIDPVSRRPEDEVRAARDLSARGEDRRRLEDHAAFMPVAESAAAAKMIELISGVLESRIDEFLKKDPQCQAVLSILDEFQGQKNLAKMAVKKLMGI